MEVQDKLRVVYDRLKSNPNISGLPDEYDKFKSAFLDKDKAKTIYERLKSEKSVAGLPDNFESFYSIVPSESIQDKIESDTAKSVENAQYGSNAAVGMVDGTPDLSTLNKQYEDFRAVNKEFMDGYRKSRGQTFNNVPTYGAMGGLNPLVSLFKTDSEKRDDERYNEIVRHEEELRKAISTHPEVLGRRNMLLESVSKSLDYTDSLIEEKRKSVPVFSRAYTNALGVKSEDSNEREIKNLQAANKMYRDAAEILKAPSKYDSSNPFLNFLKGAGDTFNDRDFWSFGLTEIARNLNMKDIAGKLSANKEGKDIADILTPGEEKMLDAFTKLCAANAERASDLSMGYSAAQSSIESLKFMAEFLVTRGAAGAASSAAKKAVSKWLVKNTARHGLMRDLGKGFVWGTDAALSALARTPLMLSTYSNITGRMVGYDEEGNLVEKNTAEALWDGFMDSLIENVSEMSGAHVAGALGIAGKQAGRLIPGKVREGLGNLSKKFKNSKLGNWAFNPEVRKFLKDAGYNGVGEEMLEEWYGAALRSVINDPEALKNFATWDNQLLTFFSFLPVALTGATVSAATNVYAKKRYENSFAALDKLLRELGADDNGVDRFINNLNGNGTKDDGDSLRNLMSELSVENEETGKELFKAMGDYIYSRSRCKVISDNWAEQQAERRREEDVRLSEETGGYVNETTGQVEIVSDAEGSAGFITGETGEGDHKVYVINVNGEKVPVSHKDLNIENGWQRNETIDKDVFLDQAVKRNEMEAALQGEDYAGRAILKDGQVVILQRTPEGLTGWTEGNEVIPVSEDMISEYLPEENEANDVFPEMAASDQGGMQPIENAEEQAVMPENNQPQIPLTENGLPDYDSMPPEMFAEEFEKEFGAEETKAELEKMVTDVDARIEKLQKKAPTNRNARAENKREILRLAKEKESVLQALERYVPKQSAEEEITGTTVPEEILVEEERLSTERVDEQVEDRQSAEEIKPVGKGFFGDIYDQFRGKAKEAINFLMSRKEGEAIGALYHKDIGDIDLVWGNEKAGLMKIARKHPEMLEDLQSKLDAMDVASSSDNRIILESPIDRAVVSKNVFDEKDKQWLLTAYEKKNANISGSSIDIEPEPEGKQNGTAPLQNESVSSNIKDINIPGEKQGEPEESAKQKILNLDKESVFLPYNKENRDEIFESVSQGEYGTEAKEDGRVEEALIELRRRSEENERNAQEAGGTLSGRQQKEIEARAAEVYAKEKGIWIPMQEIFSLGEPAPSGNENDVYFNSQDNSVYKVNNLMNSGNITSLLERIKLHNQYFPDTRYELVGFSGFGGRDIYPVLQQRYIENATFATPKEIENYMEALGFERIGDAEYSNGNVVISDLRPRNVLKDGDGDIYVVDAEFKKKESENSREDGESAGADAALFREVENYTSEEDIEEVNRLFNEELERYKSGQMRKNDMFHLGRPSGIISHFLPDLPIVMRQKIVTKGISKKHNVDIEAIKNMPSGISTPIFIFQRDIKTIGILSEMQDRDGKNICVAIEMNHAYQDGNRVLEVNSVNTFHGRDAVNIVGPIAHNNTLRWVDKEKGLDWISSAQLNGQEISNQDLSSATNIIENFENPIFPGREILSEADKYTPEEQNIMDGAQKDGTYMKAPNGKPTNLDKKQWVQVHTKAFKDWFGDWENDPKNASKVVDENGEPRVVFHGAPSIFNTFDTYRIGSNTGTADGRGFYFTTDKDYAKGFGSADGRVIEAFLNIRNPLDYSKKTISKSKLREIVKEIDRQEYENEGEHYFLSNYGDYTRGLSKVVDEAVDTEYEYSDNDVELVNSMIASSGSVELIMNAVEKLTGKSSMIAPKSNGSVHYIITSPNQIKSATDNSGEFSKENNDIRFREVDDRDVSSFAKKYGFDKEDVKKYAYGMQSGNLGGASYAFKNIRRKARLDNDVSSLGEFVKLFSPIQNELFEKFGSVDVLREEQEKTHMNQVDMMEAARKRAEEEVAAERKRLEEFELMIDEQLDSEYFKALEANNEGRMRDLVNEAARRNGYVSSDEFRMAHRAPSYDEEGHDKSMIDVAKNKDDIRESLNEQFRMNRDRSRHESVIAIENALSAIDKGEKPTVTIYRAAPKSLKEGKVRNGDWVTLSESYAKQHGNHALDGNYRIMKEEVPVENLYWDGNDINEWGYDDRSDYRYRDVKNNRKLNDLITRDDSGKVIPLSERFNSRKNDPRFRQNESSGMSIAEVNGRFNEELEQQINGKLPKGHVYQLGMPGKVLQSAGIPDLPIELVASRLSLKASEAYESNHPFGLSEVKNLPEAIQNPIAVFDSKTRAGSKVIMTELTDIKGHHFVVAMSTNIPANQYTRRTLQINSIRSVYPKDNIRDIVNWINRGDLLKWSDKTKLGNWLTQQRSNSADVAMSVSELNVATNIIQNFKNPTILEGEISSEIDQISEELGVKVNKVQSRKDLPDGIQRQMKNGRYPGLFDPKTGEVYMVMDEIIDVADAQATMLHEIVGHKGIRGLFGKKIGEFTNRVLDSMPENERQEWIKKYNGNEQLAAEEYVARFAEGYENPGVWEKIKAIFRELLRDCGIDLKLSDNDLKYILWRGVKSMQQDGTFIKTAEYITRDREIQRTLFREEDEVLNDPETVKVLKDSGHSVRAISNLMANLLDQKASVNLTSRLLSRYVKMAFDRDMVAAMGKRQFDSLLNKIDAGVRGSYEEISRKAAGLIEERRRLIGEYDIATDKSVRNLLKAQIKEKDTGINDIAREELNDIFRRISAVAVDVELKRQEDRLNRLTHLKVEGRNASGVSVAKTVDEDTKNVIKFIREHVGEDMTVLIESLEGKYSGGPMSKEDAIRMKGALVLQKYFAGDNSGEFVKAYVEITHNLSGEIDRLKEEIERERGYAKEVNRDFNQALDKLTEENADDIVLSLGVPNPILRSAGISDKPMKLYGNKVIKKMKKHGFALSELRNLPDAVADPIAVFDNLGREGNRSVLTELKTEQGNFLVSIDWGKGEKDVDFNIVSSVFGKKDNRIADWISNEKATYINKEKALNYLHHSAPIAEALSNSRLNSVTNIVNNFENPSIEETNPDKRKLADLRKKLKNKKRELSLADHVLFDNRASFLGRLRELNDHLEEFIYEGRSEFLEWVNREEKRKKEIVGSAMRDMDTRPMDKQGQPLDKAKRSKKEKIMELIRKYPLSVAWSFDYLVKHLSKNAMNGEGEFYDHIFRGEDGLFEASGKEWEGMISFRNELDKKVKEIFGEKYDYEQLMKESNQEMDGIILTLDEGKSGQIFKPTLGQGLYIVMIDRMTDAAQKLRAYGISDSDVAKVREALPEKYVRFSRWVQDEFLPERKKKYNETHVKLFGSSMANIRNYFPLLTQKSSIYKKIDVNNSGNDPLPSSITGSIINRKPNYVIPDLNSNAFEVLLNHGKEMEHWNAYARVNKDLSTVLSSTAFRRMLNDKDRNLFDRFKTVAQISVGSYRPNENDLNRIVANVMKGFTAAKINFRLNTAIKQVFSAPAFVVYSLDRNFQKRIYRYMSPDKWVENWKWGMENLPLLEKRWKGRNIGNEKLEDGLWIDQLTDSKLVKSGMLPNAAVDALTCVNGARAVYEFKLGQYRELGMREEEAIRRAKVDAEIAFNETQQSSEGSMLSEVQMNRNIFASGLSVFNNSNFLYLRQSLEALDELQRDKEKEIASRVRVLTKVGISEEVARISAEREVNLKHREAYAKLGMFGFMINNIWNIGGVAVPALTALLIAMFGDDDKEREEARDYLRQVVKDILGPKALGIALIRNFPGGKEIESFSNGFDVTFGELPGYADIKKVAGLVDKGIDNGEFDPAIAYEVFRMIGEGAAGVDLNVAANMYLAIHDAVASGGVNLLEDSGLFLNAPASQIREIAKRRRNGESLNEYIKRISDLNFTYRFLSDDTPKWLKNELKARYNDTPFDRARKELNNEKKKEFRKLSKQRMSQSEREAKREKIRNDHSMKLEKLKREYEVVQ